METLLPAPSAVSVWIFVSAGTADGGDAVHRAIRTDDRLFAGICEWSAPIGAEAEPPTLTPGRLC